MHLFEWLGLFLLFSCGVATGYVLALFEQRRASQAEGFLSLLRHVRMQIDCFCLPVSKILARLDRGLLTDCGAPEGARDFPALLLQTKLWLPDEACTLLADFSKDLGTSYREEQLRCCDYYIARLNPICEKLRAELPRRIRLAWLLPIALCTALILLLI